MFGSGDFGDKSPSHDFLKILKLPKNALGQFISNCPAKHVITNINLKKLQFIPY